MLIRALPVLAVAAGCQGHPAASGSAADDARADVMAGVEVRAHGRLVARVVPGHPCRATVDGIEMLVGGPPLTSQVGDVAWRGEDRDDGTMLLRQDQPVVRIRSAADSLMLFDAEGVALFRAAIAADGARVIGRDGAVARIAKRTTNGIRVDDAVVTGTDDLLLAALLTASEAGPDVRALAACHRLLTIGKVL